ncbi:hypothetical protein M432DRAFT_662443 [Thermoascus aurantiacus ATCC 26904]
MASTASNLAVVICHGSYHSPALYEPLIQALKAPNVGDVNNPDFDREPPPGGYPSEADDAQVIVQLLDRLISYDGKLVLLAAHSSGGWVAAEAARPELQAKSRKEEGKSGGVIGIFFIGALVVPAGESVTSLYQSYDGALVEPSSLKFHKLTNDPYSTVPCAYLVLERDKMLPRQFQEKMAAAQSRKSSDNPFTMYRAPCGHAPYISWTDGLVGKMEESVGEVMA